MTQLLTKTTDLLFGCWHTNYSWPQGKGKECHVNCLECGREFPFDPEKWRVRRAGELVEVKQ